MVLSGDDRPGKGPNDQSHYKLHQIYSLNLRFMGVEQERIKASCLVDTSVHKMSIKLQELPKVGLPDIMSHLKVHQRIATCRRMVIWLKVQK